jgi:exoribonuclease-2
LLLHVPGLGVHARGTRLQMEVMSIDELTVEASVRLLHVLDAPTVTSGSEAEEADEADEADEGEEEEIVEASDESAEREAEAQAEADAEGDSNANDASSNEGSSNADAGQHITEPGR